MNKKKNKLSNKIFIFITSTLFFSFLIVLLFSRFFLEKYTVRYKVNYLEEIYQKINNINYDDENFLRQVHAVEFENIYFECIDLDEGKIIYSSSGIVGQLPEDIESTQIFSLLKEHDMLKIASNSELEEEIFNITNRKYQISVIGTYMNSDSKYLILETPYQPITSISVLTSRFYLISMIIVLLISLAPSKILVYSITKPLKEATAVAKKIQNKDFSERCIIRTKDEVAELGSTINMMADSINTYSQEIENANTSLKLDIEKMKKIEQAQKEFVSNVSHEIKTPISIISGYAEAIKQDLPTTKEEKNEYCDIIIDECDRMTAIVIELLNLSKLESGSIKLDYSDFSATDLCDIVISKFKLKCSQNNIKLVLKTEEDSEYMVRADYNEIEKVIINYVQNAYKHVSENGTITILLKKEGEYVYIGVNNDGNGIDDEEMLHIWDKFYKLDKSHKREENSTGLGLSIVKATMNLHKMPYGVKNTQNGVEFYIKIRASEKEQD